MTMETKKHYLLILLALLPLATAFATEGQIKVLKSKDPEIFKLIYAAESEDNISIRVSDSGGKIVYKNKMVKSKGFMLPLSFKGLPSDRYKVEIVSGDQRLTEEIHYVNIIDRLKELLAVEFDSDNKKCTVTSNSDYSGDWSIMVFNENNDELISDTIENSTFNSRIYDLNGAPGEKLAVVVTYRDQVVSEWSFDDF